MMHLITVAGNSAKNFYLEQRYISDFKSLMRTITSGRVLLVSTKFQSDLFYYADKPENDSILKLWALYANTSVENLPKNDVNTAVGDEESLSRYFESISKLSMNWYRYRLYKKAFQQSFSNDQENPVIKKVVQCDQYLVEYTGMSRTPLVIACEKTNSKLSKDTFSLAMHIMNNQALSN